jgi:hypothetical protein
MDPVIMPRKRVKNLLGFLVLLAALGIVIVHLAWGLPAASMADANEANSDLPRREADSPAISFIDSPSPTCYRPAPGTGACYIQWQYLSVTAAASSYIISMTVSIDDDLRAYHGGFFQTSMIIPAQMTAPGYRVTCGLPGSGGLPDWGNIYSYQIRARDTAGLSAANSGSVRCPADTVTIYLPIVMRP